MPEWIDTSNFPKAMKLLVEGLAPPPSFPEFPEIGEEERRKYALEKHKIAIDLWKLQITSMNELAKYAIEYSKLSITQLLSINSGAAFALLALFGTLSGRSTPEPLVNANLVFYAISIYIFGIISSIFITITNQFALRAGSRKLYKSMKFWIIGIYISYSFAIIAFIIGTIAASSSFLL